jgi:hypothetical protein
VASFEIDGDALRLQMSWIEKLEGMAGNVAVPLATVAAVRTVPTAWPELRGVRAPGTGLPGVIAVGTRRGAFGKDFAVVHGKGPAVVVELEGAPYGRLVATVPDPQATATMILAASRR